MTVFAPVGNGRVIAYFFTRDDGGLSYLRGTNVLRVNADTYAAVGEDIVAGDFDVPPLAGATRAAIVDKVPDLPNRDAVQDVYARSVLVIAQHQMPNGEFLVEQGDDVLLAYALDMCGERSAAEAFYMWALQHRDLDGLLMWGLEQHVRVAYGSALREEYMRLKDGPGPELAATAPHLPPPTAASLTVALRKRNRLDLFADHKGLDLAEHARFLVAVSALIPKRTGGWDDFFFEHQGDAQETHRARALYAGAFHAGLTAQGADPAREVEIRGGLGPSTIHVEPDGAGRYRLGVQTAHMHLWASDSDPRPGGQEFAFGTDDALPDWMHDAIGYQLMVDRFAGTNGPLPPPGSPTALYGGTLEGVRRHLDHIAGLGCNLLWLTPVHKTPSHHGYDYEDFYEVEPRYGGDAALKSLIDGAHALGMRVLLDFVPNHTGRGHHLFRDALAKGGEAAQFYRFWQWPHFYRCFADGVIMPELDTGSRVVQRYLVQAAQYWLTEYGADGLRCDHVAGADPAFWPELRRGVRAVKPDAVVLGEATGRFEWLARYAGRLDAIFDFDFAHMVRDTFARDRIDVAEFARWLDAHEGAFPGLGRATLFDNHDMTRFLFLAGGDKRRLELAATLLMTLPGMPFIYYGSEVGLSQRHDGRAENAEARLPMLWGADQDQELLAHFQRLGRLRRGSGALRRGSRRTLSAGDGKLVYERTLGDERIVVTLDVRSLRGSVVDGSGRDRLGEDDVLGVGPDQRPR